MKLQKIGFIGLGLIGGSIAKRLRILHKDLVIIATAGHAATIEAAYKEGLTDNASPCELSDFYDCDYIFLCTPVQKNMEYLRLLKGHVCDRCIITSGWQRQDRHSPGSDRPRHGGAVYSADIRWQAPRRPVLPMLGNFYWKMLTIFLPRPPRPIPLR